MENNNFFKTVFDFLFRISLSLLIVIAISLFLLSHLIEPILGKIIFIFISVLFISLIPQFDISINDLYKEERHQEWYYKSCKYLALFPLLVVITAIIKTTPAISELNELFICVLYISIAYFSIVEPFKIIILDKCNKDIINKSKILDDLCIGIKVYEKDNEIYLYTPYNVCEIALTSEYIYKCDYIKFLNKLLDIS